MPWWSDTATIGSWGGNDRPVQRSARDPAQFVGRDVGTGTMVDAASGRSTEARN